jgi:hypothetical protein
VLPTPVKYFSIETYKTRLPRYTAAKADLEKAELEREALYDALQESRAALADVRCQRDALESHQAGVTAAGAFLKKVCLVLYLTSGPERHKVRDVC